jgi:hypothetical protein
MRQKSKQTEPTQDVHFTPSLDAAIAAWLAARYAFLNKSSKSYRDAYEAARNLLGLSFSRCFEQPELAEECGLWFISHPEVWSTEGSDSASGL